MSKAPRGRRYQHGAKSIARRTQTRGEEMLGEYNQRYPQLQEPHNTYTAGYGTAEDNLSNQSNQVLYPNMQVPTTASYSMSQQMAQPMYAHTTTQSSRYNTRRSVNNYKPGWSAERPPVTRAQQLNIQTPVELKQTQTAATQTDCSFTDLEVDLIHFCRSKKINITQVINDLKVTKEDTSHDDKINNLVNPDTLNQLVTISDMGKRGLLGIILDIQRRREMETPYPMANITEIDDNVQQVQDKTDSRPQTRSQTRAQQMAAPEFKNPVPAHQAPHIPKPAHQNTPESPNNWPTCSYQPPPLESPNTFQAHQGTHNRETHNIYPHITTGNIYRNNHTSNYVPYHCHNENQEHRYTDYPNMGPMDFLQAAHAAAARAARAAGMWGNNNNQSNFFRSTSYGNSSYGPHWQK